MASGKSGPKTMARVYSINQDNLRNAMMALTVAIGIFLFQPSSFSQPVRNIGFVTYEHVIADLQSSDNLRQLWNTYNYTAVLLLDSSKIDLIIQTGFQHVEVFRSYGQGLYQTDNIVGFVTNFKDIKEIFQDQPSLERILECTHSHESLDIEIIEIDFPIYVKENEAVFETSGPTWTDTYFARLKNGIFQIVWLGGMNL